MGTRVDSRPEAAARKAGEAADDVAESRTLAWLARAGFVARGLVYLVIAILALKLAVGEEGTTTNQQEALRTIAGQPFGRFLLVLVAAGLAGYALWMLVRAAIGHGAEGEDSPTDRVSALVSAVAYGVLCATTVEILVGAGAESGSTKQATGGVLGWPGGPALVAIAGAILIGVAGYQVYKGVARKFLDDADTGEMEPRIRDAYSALGTFGYVARAIVFALVGYGLIKAAIAYDPKKALGLDGALHNLANASYGPPLLWIVAIGLFGFAVFSIADARYHKV